MATIRLTTPPTIHHYHTYTIYKPWLLENFFYHICAYCLLQHNALEIDHYEPKYYAPDRITDPTNLLLACPICNGRGGKSDYHPQHMNRTRLPQDKTNYLAIDVRTESFGDLYQVMPEGTLKPNLGENQDRAAWNAEKLFKFNLEYCRNKRKELLDLLNVCEQLLSVKKTIVENGTLDKADKLLRQLIPSLSRQFLFFQVFDIPVSNDLQVMVLEILT